MPEIPFQPSKFQDISVYDVPTLYFTQLFEGELGNGIVRNLYSRDRLTPKERTLYSDYIKKSVREQLGLDGSSLTDWAADLATNPFVWLALAITPSASAGMKKGIFHVSQTEVVKKHAPWLQQIGLLTGMQSFRNQPALIEALLGIKNLRDERIQGFADLLGPSREKLINNLRAKGLKVDHNKGLDKNLYARGTAEREAVEEIEGALVVRLRGLDTDWTSSFQAVEKGELESIVIQNRAHAGVAETDAMIAKWGLDEMIASSRRALDDTFIHTMGNETLLARFGGDASEVMRANRRTHWVIDQMQKAGKTQDEINNFLSSGAFESRHGFKPVVVHNKHGLDNVDSLVDSDKVFRLYRPRYNEVGTDPLRSLNDEYDSHRNAAEAFMDHWFGARLDQIKKGINNPKELMDDFGDILEGQLIARKGLGTLTTGKDGVKKVISDGEVLGEGVYFPRSATVPVDQSGRVAESFKDIQRLTPVDPSAPTITSPGSLATQNTRGTNVMYSDDFYELLENKFGGAAFQEVKSKRDWLLKNAHKYEDLRLASPSFERQMSVYGNQSSAAYALYSGGTTLKDGKRVLDPKIWRLITDAQIAQKEAGIADEVGAVGREIGTERPRLMEMEDWVDEAGEKVYRPMMVDDVFESITDPKGRPIGGFSLSDVLEQSYHVLDPHSREVMRHVLVPRSVGRRSLEQAATGTMSVLTKKAANYLAKGPFGEMLSKGGNVGKNMRDFLSVYGDPANLFVGKGAVGRNAASWLYVSHLGFNPASIMLNLTQPFLTTANIVGWDNVAKGYADAFKDLGKYFKLRKERHGFNLLLSPVEREALIRDSFALARNPRTDPLDIGPGVLEAVDAGLAAEVQRTSGAFKYGLMDFPLKLFEKAEWMNRLVSAHATKHAYQSAIKRGQISKTGSKGIPILQEPTEANGWVAGDMWGQYTRDMRSLVQETQFGSGFLNTPLTFMEGFEKARGGLGTAFLSNPLMRQFMQFPLRFFTGALYTPKQIGSGVRQLRNGKEIQGNPAVPALLDFGRAMGTSAAAYYTIRDFTGAEPDRALYAESVSSFPQMFFQAIGMAEGPSGLQGFTPPAISVMNDIGNRYLLKGEKEALGTGLARLIPGGVALQRALGVMDQNQTVLGDLTSNLQKTYADWDNPTDNGEIPVFKGDGTFIQYASPVELIMSGAGLDMGKFAKEKGNIEGYMLAQRDEIVKYKRAVMTAYLANDVANAERYQREYEKRFGIPMRISDQQFKAFQKNRVIARPERMLDRMPPESRMMYSNYVAASGRTGLPEEAFESHTATERTKMYGRPDLNVDPVMLDRIKKLTEETERTDPNQLTFLPYSSRQ